MPTKLPSTLTDAQRIAVETYEKNNFSETATAKALGVHNKTLRSHLWLASKKGWVVPADRWCEHAPAGFGLTKSTLHVNKLGEVIQQWPRIAPVVPEIDREYFLTRLPAMSEIPAPDPVKNSEYMLEWCIFDHHQGMLSWAAETGSDYDTEIARGLMISAARRIFSTTGYVAKTVIIGGGDNVHADNRSNKTEKSQNILDVDTRYQRKLF